MEELFKSLGIDPSTVNYNVTIATPDEMRDLKRDHLGIDAVTDVLSFPMLDLEQGDIPTREKFPFDINPETGKIELGDIIINETEPDRDGLIQHGLMHLLGYHHDDSKEDDNEQ